MAKILTYSELRRFSTFEERFEYLSLKGIVGKSTFGFDRWINQNFYRSQAWKSARDAVVVRDLGCDLGISGYEIQSGLLVHHMNPMTPEDVKLAEDWITDQEYLITTSITTHNAIHFGDISLCSREPIVRQPGDTKLW